VQNYLDSVCGRLSWLCADWRVYWQLPLNVRHLNGSVRVRRSVLPVTCDVTAFTNVSTGLMSPTAVCYSLYCCSSSSLYQMFSCLQWWANLDHELTTWFNSWLSHVRWSYFVNGRLYFKHTIRFVFIYLFIYSLYLILIFHDLIWNFSRP